MFQSHWHARRFLRAAVAPLAILLFSAFLFAGCGLFGGDDEPIPEVVEPPASTTQQDDTNSATATATSAQDQDQPTEAVQVTTSPSEDDQAQPDQPSTANAQSEDQADPTIYVVQPGDTLAQIANQLGVRIDDLITLNGIQNPDLLQVGQELKIPSPSQDEAGDEVVEDEQDESVDQQDEQQSQADDEGIDPPSVTLPTVAVPAATPTRVSYTQFPQPGPELTTDTIPDVPTSFLQYGAAALPWLHGISEVNPIIELFKAWPMPALAVGNDRIVLVDTNGDAQFSVSIIYTDPNSFGAAVPYSNLVVYDQVPGNPSRYRIAYDHALAYAREVQGIQQISDLDLTGDTLHDLTFREITCDASGCVSSFYILSSTGDGYRTVTSSAAQVAEVSAISIEDLTGDGVLDLVVEGLATDESTAAQYTFVFTARDDSLVETARLSTGGSADQGNSEQSDGDSLEE